MPNMSRHAPKDNPTMTIQEFSQQFNVLMHDAVKARVPLPHLIMTLAMTQTELGIIHVETMRNLQAKLMAEEMAKNAPKIVS